MKVFKRICLAAAALILTGALLACSILFFYYPLYRNHKVPVRTDSPMQTPLRIMSANVRCLTPNDLGKKSWFYRADLILQNIQNELPTVIGFQEVTKWQYQYLCDTLPEFDSVITYRDDTLFAEGCPVFYNTALYNLRDKGSFWLSDTPEVMSKDWDSACYRICSYVILEEKATKKQFVVFNTHLDHVSDLARINGIGVVLDKIAQFGSLPSVIIGDLNADEDSETYRSATESFFDAKYQLENPQKSATYQNWGAALDNPCIDYALISKTGFTVTDYKVVQTTYDGVYPSDHFPVVVELQLSD